MKRKSLRITRYIIIGLMAAAVGLIVANAVKADAESDAQLAEIDSFIESHTPKTHYKAEIEPETVQLTYSAYLAEKAEEEAETEPQEPDIYSMDVWQLGSYLYGISELDTTRTLKLISYEGYGESALSYYVACCCWVRCTNGYLGFDNLYSSFGGADTSYNEWMDEIEIADYAYDALWQCYMNPSYVTSCNGMECPAEYVYAEFDGSYTIYVW
jgi:hypothetical protein